MNWLKYTVVWMRHNLWLHKWEYRNPYNRTCSVCGRNEVEHCWPGDEFKLRAGWWEVFDEGDESKHYW